MSNQNAQHTPGPWVSIDTGVWAENGLDTPQWEIVWGGHNTRSAPLAERQANARLIAAAPDLLATLETLYASFQHTDDNPQGNKVKTEIIKLCPDVKEALNQALWTLLKAKGLN